MPILLNCNKDEFAAQIRKHRPDYVVIRDKTYDISKYLAEFADLPYFASFLLRNPAKHLARDEDSKQNLLNLIVNKPADLSAAAQNYIDKCLSTPPLLQDFNDVSIILMMLNKTSAQPRILVLCKNKQYERITSALNSTQKIFRGGSAGGRACLCLIMIVFIIAILMFCKEKRNYKRDCNTSNIWANF